LRWAWLDKSTDLSYTNLALADLENAHLSDADLTHANLACIYARVSHPLGPSGPPPKCQLDPASLNGADLERTKLIGADLEHVYLEGADLRGAYLGRADLKGADLKGAKLSGAHWDHTTCPDSTDSDAHTPHSCANNRTVVARSAAVFTTANDWGAPGATTVRVDSFGHVYVLQRYVRRIQKFSYDGTMLARYKMRVINGKGFNPASFALGPKGTPAIYVSDYKDNLAALLFVHWPPGQDVGNSFAPNWRGG
jgi:hypothetical protein